jgi:hypothetical protein
MSHRYRRCVGEAEARETWRRLWNSFAAPLALVVARRFEKPFPVVTVPGLFERFHPADGNY